MWILGRGVRRTENMGDVRDWHDEIINVVQTELM